MISGVYQGGIPSLHTRQGLRQQGSGFFSGLKRFLMPIARKALPHVAGAVGDLFAGQKPMEILKSRGREMGADMLETAGHQGSAALRRRKPIKRKAAKPSSVSSAKQQRRQQTKKSWQ